MFESINFVVVLDPGHGGLDPGSIGYKTKVKESDVNLSVAKILEQKLKQSELANKLGITQRKYSYIETNKSSMSVEMLEKITEYYQVNIDYLL